MTEENYIQKRAEVYAKRKMQTILSGDIEYTSEKTAKDFAAGYTEALCEMEGFVKWMEANVVRATKNTWRYKRGGIYIFPELLALYRKEKTQ